MTTDHIPMQSGLQMILVFVLLAWPDSISLRQSSSQPELRASPLILDFGENIPGVTSLPAHVTLTNYGSAPATGLAFDLSASAVFARATTCGSVLAAGSSCTITVRFTSFAALEYDDLLRIASSEKPLTLTLSGRGAASSIQASATGLDFGVRTLFSSSPSQTIEIQNTGPVTVTSFAVSPDEPDYSYTTDCVVLAPGAVCGYSFTVMPKHEGAMSRVYSINSSGGDAQVSLRVTGVSTEAFQSLSLLRASPDTVNFGDVPVGGTSALRPITFLLEGGAAITAAHGRFIPPNSVFNSPVLCPKIQEANAPCVYSFMFAPNKPGPISNTVTVGTSLGTFVLRLQGNGIPSRLETTPRLLDFGPGLDAQPQTVTLRNTSTYAVPTLDIAVPAPFTFTHQCASGIAAGASCDVVFRDISTSRQLHQVTATLSSKVGTIEIGLIGGTNRPPNGIYLPLVQR